MLLEVVVSDIWCLWEYIAKISTRFIQFPPISLQYFCYFLPVFSMFFLNFQGKNALELGRDLCYNGGKCSSFLALDDSVFEIDFFCFLE